MSRHLSYANVVATLALFVALGGSALAISKIGSKEIKNGSVKSEDLKNHAAVQNRDVKNNGLRGKAVAEGSLDASRFAPIFGDEGQDCHPTSTTVFIDCAKVTAASQHRYRVLAIATGNAESVGANGASANCEFRVDGESTSSSFAPGETGSPAHSNATATNGFARTYVSRGALAAGQHKVSLACAKLLNDVKIDVPTIAVIAISEG